MKKKKKNKKDKTNKEKKLTMNEKKKNSKKKKSPKQQKNNWKSGASDSDDNQDKSDKRSKRQKERRREMSKNSSDDGLEMDGDNKNQQLIYDIKWLTSPCKQDLLHDCIAAITDKLTTTGTSNNNVFTVVLFKAGTKILSTCHRR